MSADIIVSYDGTPNDDDALALGRALAATGARLALAYVRHSREFDPRREELADHDAHRRVQGGAELLGDPSVATHVVLSASTNTGLEQLADNQGAALIVFGSDYRTAPGRAEPGNTAQRLLEGGAFAIAVAQAGLRTRLGEPITAIEVPSGQNAPEVQETARGLADRLGARVVGAGEPCDLVLVGSQPGGPAGRVTLGGATRSALDGARGSVLVLAAGTPLSF